MLYINRSLFDFFTQKSRCKYLANKIIWFQNIIVGFVSISSYIFTSWWFLCLLLSRNILIFLESDFLFIVNWNDINSFFWTTSSSRYVPWVFDFLKLEVLILNHKDYFLTNFLNNSIAIVNLSWVNWHDGHINNCGSFSVMSLVRLHFL